MPLMIQLQGVNFGVTGFWSDQEAHDRGDAPAQTLVTFTDAQSGIVVTVPFDGPAWENFQRHVEKNGDVPAIALARGIPENGAPRMEVPRGK